METTECPECSWFRMLFKGVHAVGSDDEPAATPEPTQFQTELGKTTNDSR